MRRPARQRRRAPRSLQDSALRDPLTGLANRLLLHQRLGRAGERAQQSQSEVAVLFADLDRFKQVNDTYGHVVGDELLVAVARAPFQPRTTRGHPGPGERRRVRLRLRGTKSAGDVEGLARRIDEAFGTPFVLADVELTVTASVGIAYSGPGAKVTHQLIVDADIAMYQAKRNGGAGHQIIDLREAGRSTDRCGLGAGPARSPSHGTSSTWRSSRWCAAATASSSVPRRCFAGPIATRGAVSPLEIVEVAEENGLIVAIGAWVLEQACLQRGRWLDLGHPLDLAVNVSTRQLMGVGFCDSVAAVLRQTGMDPSALVLELTGGTSSSVTAHGR